MLPKGSETQVQAIIELGLDLVLLGPNIDEAVYEALTRTSNARAQNPYLALALFGHNHLTATRKTFERFRLLFNVKAINDFFEIEYSNVTLNVSGVFNPRAGIYIRENHRLIDGNRVRRENQALSDGGGAFD